ncbi:hypothetical protein [Nocardioides zeae]|uniref:Lipoprotein n=1 Tax=Nocardioides zeae TaxID=1457234 RepID=A0A6P0HCX6_9ACTN|nr:hypothetical protein [Nocardioides zeae]NEN76683.1 hypothetical protein [Nocardioides zeae]
MRPSTAALLSLPVGLLVLVGCASDPEFTEVRIVSTTWNGWDPDYEPTTTTSTLAPAEGEETVVGCGVTITVVGVEHDRALLRSDEALAPVGDTGGIDLRDTQDEVEVAMGEVVEMSTATMDGGCGFELSVG